MSVKQTRVWVFVNKEWAGDGHRESLYWIVINVAHPIAFGKPLRCPVGQQQQKRNCYTKDASDKRDRKPWISVRPASASFD